MNPVTAALISSVMANLIKGVLNLAATINMTDEQLSSWIEQERKLFYSTNPSTLPDVNRNEPIPLYSLPDEEED